jgi:hypothetical protein
MVKIVWTDYLEYRTKLRGFELEIIEEIVKYGDERYFDTSTNRKVVIGKHNKTLVLIPYDTTKDNIVTPVTIHATTRQQINYRVKSGRYRK